MSSEYRRTIRSELAGKAAKWLSTVKLLLTLLGYLSAVYLWSQGAPVWQIAAVTGVSVALSFILLYVSGRSAWTNEHIARVKAETALHEITSSAPKLRPREPGAVHIEPIQFFGPDGRLGFEAYFLKIRLVNDPEHSSRSSEAQRVLAKIAYRRGGQLLREVDGRWSESEQPIRRILNFQTTVDLLHMDFGIGAERSLDLVFKKDGDSDAYIFNNDNYHALPDYKKPEHRLEPGEYQVQIRLRAAQVDEVFAFDFVNPGAGKRLAVTNSVASNT